MAIIVGCLIIISIVACIINCMCCGIQCCKCCGCCSCCCPSPRNRPDRTKYLDDPAYHQPPPPPPTNPYRPPAPPVYQGAQTARFDEPPSKSPNVNEDALPAMPTWDTAVSRRVEDTSQRDDMEMEPLNPAQHRQPSPRPTPALATTYRPGYRGIDDHGAYSPRSPTIPSPNPMSSPYEQQSYRDFGNPYQARTGTPATVYSQSVYSQPTYNPMPTPAPPPGMPRYTPIQRQPSPASIQPSIQPPSYTTQAPYQAFSPPIPTSPPPSFTTTPAPYQAGNNPGRPPTLLQSGRKPVPNSYRDI